MLAAGGILGAVAASSCCILPLVLFSVGVGGAWIGRFTQLAPYQPLFIAFTAACLIVGSLLVRRASGGRCADGSACIRRLPQRIMTTVFVVAGLLVAAALAWDALAPLLLES
jgi:mercuric ion transport protein